VAAVGVDQSHQAVPPECCICVLLANFDIHGLAMPDPAYRRGSVTHIHIEGSARLPGEGVIHLMQGVPGLAGLGVRSSQGVTDESPLLSIGCYDQVTRDHPSMIVDCHALGYPDPLLRQARTAGAYRGGAYTSIYSVVCVVVANLPGHCR
jgi:hypothetical protein